MNRLTLWVVCLGLVAAGLQAGDHTFQYQRIVEVGDRAELSLTCQDGDIEIIGHDQSTIIIDAVKHIKIGDDREAAEIADHIEIRVEHNNQAVKVAANYLPIRERGRSFWQKVLGRGKEDSFGEVSFSIKVPRNCRVTLDNGEGDVRISEIDGDLRMNSSAQSIALTTIHGSVEIRSAAASVVLTSIEGAVDIANSAGSTRGDMLFGPVTVRQPTGAIDLQFVDGDVRVKTTSADVTIRQERGAIDLTTVTGSVTIQTPLETSRDLFIETESGDITLMVPPEASGVLRLKSESGTIKTELPVKIDKMSTRQLVGTVGVGGIQVSLVTISGDVTVAQF
ncbi:MAG: DUF4097 family beta strand repeat protein [bacterium]|nr:DUF4097 family beta strand repeat protein [bacterium]